MKRYNKYIEEIEEIPSSQTTQRSSTEKSYIKVGSYIASNFLEAEDILDFGAGLGKGTIALKKQTGKSVESFEPFAKGFTPDYNSFNQINKRYDIIVNLNVLNVLPLPLRDKVVKQIFKLIKPGGIAIIGTRAWRYDVDTVKNFIPDENEDRAIWVLTRNQKVFQKGFDGKELENYVKSVIPVKVKPMGSKFAKNSIIIYKG